MTLAPLPGLALQRTSVNNLMYYVSNVLGSWSLLFVLFWNTLTTISGFGCLFRWCWCFEVSLAWGLNLVKKKAVELSRRRQEAVFEGSSDSTLEEFKFQGPHWVSVEVQKVLRGLQMKFPKSYSLRDRLGNHKERKRKEWKRNIQGEERITLFRTCST